LFGFSPKLLSKFNLICIPRKMSVYSEEGDQYSTPGSDAPEYHEYNNYYDEVSEKSIDNSFRHQKHGAKVAAKFEDKGFNRIRRALKGKAQNEFIDYYETSSNPDVYIRDAISGAVRAPYRTGTIDEDMFFSVRLATGEGRTRGGSNLFYDSPEQYERHFHIELSRELKEQWRVRAMKARERYTTKVAEAGGNYVPP
jgi:hypothetical protein